MLNNGPTLANGQPSILVCHNLVLSQRKELQGESLKPSIYSQQSPRAHRPIIYLPLIYDSFKGVNLLEHIFSECSLWQAVSNSQNELQMNIILA